MKLFLPILLAGALLSALVDCQIPEGCVNLTIPVTVTAENMDLPLNLDPANFLVIVEELLGDVLDATVSGTFNIAATYCEPVNAVEDRFNTLQVLVHGATYTKAYWFGEYFSDYYSWVVYASNAGYPTLSIDRLGNGESQRPDPILDVQDPIHVEIIHNIIGYARNDELEIPIRRKFNRIILAGHSLGSVISNVLNYKYPWDADCTILTGFAPILPINEIGILVQGWLLSADLIDSRYSNLNPAYLEFSNRADFDFLFYYPGQYYAGMESLDWDTRGTFSLGEAATAALPSQVAEQYVNPLLVVTGSHDSFFCSFLSLDIQILLGAPNCDTTESGPAAQVQPQLYPNVRSFGVLYPDAGHCWHLHYTAPETFAQVHDWLASEGF